MRTSPSQFEMLVTFMEQHGDLTKLSTSARGRLTSIRNWEELTGLLNSDGAGDTKTTEKWKKVWSDFKNNTKKKAAHLHRKASGTGGGPAVFAKLSDLEQRVLNLMGLQVATGLAVEEAGLSQEVHIQPSPSNVDEQGILPLPRFQEYSQTVNQVETNIASPPQSPPPPSLLRAISSPPFMFVEQEVESSQPNWHEAGPSRLYIAPAHSPSEARLAASHNTLVEPQVEETGLLSPTRPSTQVRVGHGLASSVQTTPRRTRRTRGSPHRRARPAHSEQATQHFLQADSFWRNFKEQQHRDTIELKRERNRIRESEVQAQKDWQAIGGRLVNVLEKLADKYCKD